MNVECPLVISIRTKLRTSEMMTTKRYPGGEEIIARWWQTTQQVGCAAASRNSFSTVNRRDTTKVKDPSVARSAVWLLLFMRFYFFYARFSSFFMFKSDCAPIYACISEICATYEPFRVLLEAVPGGFRGLM